MKVSVVVVGYNEKKYTLDCLKGLSNQDYDNFETVVVDNGSTDGTSDAVRKNYPDVNLVTVRDNVGASGGFNIGADNVNEKSEIVVLLVNDTIVKESWLSELVRTFDDEKVGVAVSRIFDKYGATEFYTNDFETMSLLGYNVSYAPKDKDAEFIDIFYACGASLAYRKNLVDKPYDSDYFMYFEDTRLSWLARLKGFLVKKAKKSIVYHYGHATIKKISGKKSYYQERNRLVNFLTLHSKYHIIVLSPWYLLSMILHNLINLRVAHYRIIGYLWCLVHPFRIIKKRLAVQKQRKVKFKEVTKYMSCRFYEESSIKNSFLKSILQALNWCMCLWCRIFRIRTIESKE